jgi:hypothetical protein
MASARNLIPLGRTSSPRPFYGQGSSRLGDLSTEEVQRQAGCPNDRGSSLSARELLVPLALDGENPLEISA